MATNNDGHSNHGHKNDNNVHRIDSDNQKTYNYNNSVKFIIK